MKYKSGDRFIEKETGDWIELVKPLNNGWETKTNKQPPQHIRSDVVYPLVYWVSVDLLDNEFVLEG